MKKEIIINASKDRSRIAIVEDGELVELYVENPENVRTIGNIYLGEVKKVMPAIRAGFVDIGEKQDAFLHFSDLTDNAAQLFAMAGEDVPGLDTPILSRAPQKRVADDENEPDVEDTLEVEAGSDDSQSRTRRSRRGRGRGRGRGRSGGGGRREEEEEQEERPRRGMVIDLSSGAASSPSKPKARPSRRTESKADAPKAEPEAREDAPASKDTPSETPKPSSRRRSRSDDAPSADTETKASETRAETSETTESSADTSRPRRRSRKRGRSRSEDSTPETTSDAPSAKASDDTADEAPRSRRRSTRDDDASDAREADAAEASDDETSSASDSNADGETTEDAGEGRSRRRGRRGGRGRNRNRSDDSPDESSDSTIAPRARDRNKDDDDADGESTGRSRRRSRSSEPKVSEPKDTEPKATQAEAREEAPKEEKPRRRKRTVAVVDLTGGSAPKAEPKDTSDDESDTPGRSRRRARDEENAEGDAPQGRRSRSKDDAADDEDSGRGRRRSRGRGRSEEDTSDDSDDSGSTRSRGRNRSDEDTDGDSEGSGRGRRRSRSDSDSDNADDRSDSGRSRRRSRSDADGEDTSSDSRRSRGGRGRSDSDDADGSDDRDSGRGSRSKKSDDSSGRSSDRSSGRNGRGSDRGRSSNGRGGGRSSNASGKVPPAHELMRRGTRVLCKVTKEPISSKGSRVSTDISLAGRFLVLVPAADYIAVSKKIESSKERRRLRSLAQSLKPDDCGVIVRTVAEGRDAKSLDTDLRLLVEKWDGIKSKLVGRPKPPITLYEDVNMVSSIIRDLFSEDFDRILIDDPKVYKNVKAYVQAVAPDMADNVQLHKSKTPIYRSVGLEKQVEEAFSRRVNLKGGGYLFIETTEAMHVVDVNSGRAGRGKSQKENLMAVNLESAREVAKQLRLRDLGGIIVVDFIDLRHESDRRKVTDELKKAFKKDRAVTKLLPMSDFGLVQITRQRLRPSITAVTTDEDGQPLDAATAAAVAGAAEISQPEGRAYEEPEAQPARRESGRQESGRQESVRRDSPRQDSTPQAATPAELAGRIRGWLDAYRAQVDDRYRGRPIIVRVHPLLGAFLRRGFPSTLTRWRFSVRGISFRVDEDPSIDPLGFDVRDEKSGRSLLSKYTA